MPRSAQWFLRSAAFAYQHLLAFAMHGFHFPKEPLLQRSQQDQRLRNPVSCSTVLWLLLWMVQRISRVKVWRAPLAVAS